MGHGWLHEPACLSLVSWLKAGPSLSLLCAKIGVFVQVSSLWRWRNSEDALCGFAKLLLLFSQSHSELIQKSCDTENTPCGGWPHPLPGAGCVHPQPWELGGFLEAALSSPPRSRAGCPGRILYQSRGSGRPPGLKMVSQQLCFLFPISPQSHQRRVKCRRRDLPVGQPACKA